MRAGNYLATLLKSIVSDFGLAWPAKVTIEPPREKQFGDLAVNLALVLAKTAGKKPRDLAEALATSLFAASSHIAGAEVAGPGFINVTFAPEFWQAYIPQVEEQRDFFGASSTGKGMKAQVEFVSANPTGPLHIGHGRGAAAGDSIARIMRFAGYDVSTEYYINDAGKQMRTLGLSVWLRLLELAGKAANVFPSDCYQGGYITDIARDLLNARPAMPFLDAEEGINACYEYGMRVIMDGIKKDLADFGVAHEVWFSEKSLTEDGSVDRALAWLQEEHHTYEKEGALWFASEELGDDKDRVLKKSDGSLTYFASDIAYHANKYARSFDRIIDVWGADHHGYIPRIRAVIAALGKGQESFDVVLVQLVNLLREGEQIAMSTRAGQFETLAEVMAEVGADAARFMFLSRKTDSKLDFDLALVKQRTMDNPVYYVQYAHARVKAVERRARERGLPVDAPGDLSLLREGEELDLLRRLDRFSQVVQDAAEQHAPHFISHFLMDLAGLLHRYYAAHQILGAPDEPLVLARLRLVRAVGQVVRNGLALLGVSAPDSM